MAIHINELNIDNSLIAGDSLLPNSIAIGHGIKTRNSYKEISFYSFATKYCSYHNPEGFPEYDSRIEHALLHFNQQTKALGVTKKHLKHYARFKECLREFQIYYRLDEFTLTQIAQYLKQSGKYKEHKNYEEV